MESKKLTVKEAWMASPGPKTVKEAFLLYFKGVCMGGADIIPGVSGGTIALIMGIYHDLLKAIQSFNANFIKFALSFQFSRALEILHIRFLLSLFAGIATSLITLAHVINILLKEYPVYTWSLFLGLIGASILLLGKKVENILGTGGLGFLIGSICGYMIVGMIPVQTPETAWFIFFAGVIAICAMILPGISGAFLLLILGKYEYVTSALKNPFLPSNLFIIVVFGAGAFIGLLGFSRVLSYLLEKYHNITLAILTGLMLGSLRKVWPWKETLETTIIREKVYILREANILPQSFNTEFFVAIALMTLGFLAVLYMDSLVRRKEL
jgi:putative membrane protein